MTALQPSTDETTTAQATEPTGDTQSSVREDLLSYADLGGFTLTPKTHAWYAAADTITNSEEARAASTVLAELRGRDLPATRATAARLLAETTLGELRTAATLSAAVGLLHRVRTTLTVLTPAVYASAELEAYTAATADGRWRKERGVKLSWGQRRALRRELRPFAVVPGTRRATLHAALASAATDRKDWAELSPSAALPTLPGDAAILDSAIQAVEAAQTGLRELDRLLPEYDLATMPFDELSELVDQLAADEGTLYRLPTLRSLRDSIEQRGHGRVLDELAAQHADTEAVAAACDLHFPVRSEVLQSLLPNPREDGDATAAAPPKPTTAPKVEPTAEPEPTEALAPEPTAPAAEPETTPEPTTAETPAPAPEAPAAEPEPEAAVKAEVEAEAETATEPEAEAEVEAEVAAAEAKAEVAADAEVEPEAAVEPATEPEAVTEPEPATEPETQPEAAAEVEPEAAVETTTEPDAAAEPEPKAVTEPEAEVETEPEAEVETATEPEAESDAATDADTDAEAIAEPVIAAEVEAEVCAEAEVEAEAAVEPVTEPEAAAPAEPTTAEATPAPVPAPSPEATAPRRPRKPDFTPGRPVNAYSADELLSVVRWLDADGTTRTEDELLRAAMKEMGFSRLGPRIKEALGAAVSAARD